MNEKTEQKQKWSKRFLFRLQRKAINSLCFASLLAFLVCGVTYIVPFIAGLIIRDIFYPDSLFPLVLFMFWGGMMYHSFLEYLAKKRKGL